MVTFKKKGVVVETSNSKIELWNRLWKLQIVPKFHVLWWRVLRGILLVETGDYTHRHITPLG
jgi:hypothetical protein